MSASRPDRSQLGAARAKEVHLHVVTRVVVEGHQREPVVGEDALVGGERPELGGGHRAVGHERHSPHQRDHPAAALGAAPVCDLLVRKVEGPVGVGLGRLLGEVHRRGEAGRLRALVLTGVGDVAEQLIAVRGRGGHGHVGAPVEGAVGKPHDPSGFAQVLTPAVQFREGLEEVCAQRLGPAAVGEGFLRWLGGADR